MRPSTPAPRAAANQDVLGNPEARRRLPKRRSGFQLLKKSVWLGGGQLTPALGAHISRGLAGLGDLVHQPRNALFQFAPMVGRDARDQGLAWAECRAQTLAPARFFAAT